MDTLGLGTSGPGEDIARHGTPAPEGQPAEAVAGQGTLGLVETCGDGRLEVRTGCRVSTLVLACEGAVVQDIGTFRRRFGLDIEML
jgi:hypothetical protein